MDYSIWAINTARRNQVWRLPLCFATFYGAILPLMAFALPLISFGTFVADAVTPLFPPQTVTAALLTVPLIFVGMAAVAAFYAAYFALAWQILKLCLILLVGSMEEGGGARRHLNRLQSMRSTPQAGSS